MTARTNARTPGFFSLLTALSLGLIAPVACAQDSGSSQEPQTQPLAVPGSAPGAAATSEEAERDQRFAAYMTGAKFIGRFTMKDKIDGDLPQEEYTIAKCETLPEDGMFRFTARIKYGKTDTEYKMDLPVLFAGDTPVISLTNLWIPGLGTFSSRVVIYQGSYAGTWKHDDKGGHLFGSIQSDKPVPSESDSGEKADGASTETAPKTTDQPSIKPVPTSSSESDSQ